MSRVTYDFSGWATRNDLKCSDGRTIRKDAFKHNDGQTVPLVWNHDHNDPMNVLGHALLENRDEGVYAYCSFNSTPAGVNAKQIVQHGDVTSLSIYANKLKQYGNDVVHGTIREVSLVLAGANPGAFIDAVMEHGEILEDSGIIYHGEDELCLEHTIIDPDEKPVVPVSGPAPEPAPAPEPEAQPVEEPKQEPVEEVKAEPEPAPAPKKQTANAKKQPKQEEVVEHAVKAGEIVEVEAEVDDGETVADVFNTLTEKQKKVVYALIGQAIEDVENEGKEVEHSEIEHADNENEDEEDGETVKDVLDTLSEKQRNVVYALIGQAIEDAKAKKAKKSNNDEGKAPEGEEMKHNVFETEEKNDVTVLSHSEMAEIFSDARRCGSLKEAVLAHGIEDIDYLFPEAKAVTQTPGFYRDPDEWVGKVLNGVHKTPFSRIKSLNADLTEADARAKGYVKGNAKVEEVFNILKRTTTPTTIYKKQKIDRDDQIDITDFDVVAWLKSEMRMMLDEEIARAILVGDGRSAASNDKISETNIRPIWTDDNLFTIKKTIAVTNSTTDDAKAKAFIKSAVKARKEYRGSGNPTLFTTEDMLNDCLLMEDTTGRVIYDSIDKLATALRVKEIVAVPPMEDLMREKDGVTFELAGIIVNLNDYNVGADKGGQVNMFDDFDIDFNAQKYLIETRCSGAMIRPKSAIALELTYSAFLNVEPTDGTTTRYGKLVSALQENVIFHDDYITGTLHYVTGYTGYSGNPALQSGYYIAFDVTATDGATVTVQMLGGDSEAAPVDMTSDMYAVGRVVNKRTQKIKLTATVGGVSVSKVYSLANLVLEPHS